MSSHLPAPRAASKNSTMRSAPSPAKRLSCLATLRISPALDRLGAAIYERWKKLDIFIGNGGILGPLTPLAHVDPAQWDEVLAVNVTANWRLIRSLDLPLRASDAGRVVLITSGAGHARIRALLGSLRHLEGGARRARPHLCGRNRDNLECESHAGQSRAVRAPACAPPPCRAKIPSTLSRRKTSRRKSSRLQPRLDANRKAL